MPIVANLHEYQKLAVSFLLETPRAALYADMGLGKTLAVLTVIDTLMHVGYDDPILVLAPKRVAQDVWPTEALKWAEFRNYYVMPIVGNQSVREVAVTTRAHIHTCNYENLEWLVQRVSPQKWPWKMIVADESTKLKGFRLQQGGKRARALSLVARLADRWINLSGTPAPNGLKDLWGQFWFLDQGERLGRTYTGFMQRWFRQSYDGFGTEPMPHAEREIHERIGDITMALRARDWFDLEQPKVNEIRVRLPDTLRTRYKQLERDLFTELQCGTEVEVFNAAALTTKCLQFANGACYTKAPAWVPVHDLKLQALESIVNESGGKQLLVSYEFQSDRDRILKAFRGAVDISTAKGLAAFKGGQVQIGVAHPASMGHGIDGLQHGCWTLVYFGHGWAMDLRDQILERIGPMRQKQGGYDRVVEVYNIICDGTLDDDVIDRHESKRTVQEALTAAMSRRST